MDIVNKHFVDTFYYVKDTLTDACIKAGVSPPRILLAGGAVRDVLFRDAFPKDFDFYLIPPVEDFEKYLDNITSIIYQTFAQVERPFHLPDNFDSLSHLYRYWETNGLHEKYNIFLNFANASVYLQKDFRSTCQFLWHVGKSSFQDIIDEFDLDICQLGYDGKSFYQGSHVDVGKVKIALSEGGDVTLMNLNTTETRLEYLHESLGCCVEEAKSILKRYLQETGERPREKYLIMNGIYIPVVLGGIQKSTSGQGFDTEDFVQEFFDTIQTH